MVFTVSLPSTEIKEFYMKLTVLALTVWIFTAGQAVIASSNNMEEIVVVGTRSEKVYQENPYSISVLTKEAIRRSTKDQLADLLADSPGITLSDAGQAGQKRIRIRGEEARRMALLVDGQEFGDHREVGVPLLVDISRIQRIEVVRGPASVLYGPKAMGGVINVITRGERDESLRGSVSSTYDSATDGYYASANLGGFAGNFGFEFGGFKNDQGLRDTPEGEVENTEYESHGFHAGLDYIAGDHAFAIAYEDFNSDSEVYVEPKVRFTPPFVDFAIDTPRRDRNKIRLDYDYTHGDGSGFLSALSVDAYRQTADREFNTFPSLMLSPVTRLDTTILTESELQSDGFNVQSDWTISDRSDVVVGFQWVDDVVDQFRHREAKINGMTTSLTDNIDEAGLETSAVYLQGDLDINEDISILAGVRYYSIDGELDVSSRDQDNVDYSDDHTIGSLALVYRLADHSTIRVNVSEGYIFPSLLNLAVGAFAGSRYINPDADLKPETSITYEIGYRYNMEPLTLDVTGFTTESEDYIDHLFCVAADNCLGRRDKIYKNVGEADTHGIEFAATYETENIEYYGQITWLKRKKRYEGVDTWHAGVPEVSGQAGLRYAFSLQDKPLSVDLKARFEGETKEEVLTSHGPETENHSGFVVFDADAAYTWNEHLNFHLTVANIGDKSYHSATENLLAPGRHLRLKFSLSL